MDATAIILFHWVCAEEKCTLICSGIRYHNLKLTSLDLVSTGRNVTDPMTNLVRWLTPHMHNSVIYANHFNLRAFYSLVCSYEWTVQQSLTQGGTHRWINSRNNHDYLEFHVIIFVLLNSTSDGSVTSCLHWANFKRRHAINGLKGKIYEIWLVWWRTVRVENRREGWVVFWQKTSSEVKPGRRG